MNEWCFRFWRFQIVALGLYGKMCREIMVLRGKVWALERAAEIARESESVRLGGGGGVEVGDPNGESESRANGHNI